MSPAPWQEEIRDTWERSERYAPRKTIDGITRPDRDEDFVRRHNGNGRPYIRILSPDGTVLETETTYSRCTTFIKVVDSNEALVRWGERMIGLGFAARPREFQAEVVRFQEDKQKLNGVVVRAKEAGGALELAAMGSAMHYVAECYDVDALPSIVPEPYQTGLLGWIAATQHFENVKVEKFMVQDSLMVAGTPDRVIRYIPCDICGREYFILDLKTGRVDEYTELQIAMQLGVYANSAYYNVHTGERTQQDDICRDKAVTVKVFLDDGSWVTSWTDIWTGWQVAKEVAPLVHKARASKALLVPFRPQVNLYPLIERAQSQTELVALHTEHRATWGEEHNKAAKARMQALKDMTVS